MDQLLLQKMGSQLAAVAEAEVVDHHKAGQ